MEQLSPDLVKALNVARQMRQAAVIEAEARGHAVAFLEQFIGHEYALQDGDVIEDDGSITRAVKATPDREIDLTT